MANFRTGRHSQCVSIKFHGMHHPHSVSAVIRFRFAAILLLCSRLCVPIAASLLVYAVVACNRHLTIIGAGLAVLAVLLVILQWIAACHTGCPLCRTPVLAPKACMKHRRARTFIGSHRLRVALAILLKSQFRCPYCNESTSMELRNTLYRPVTRSSRLD